MSGIIDVDTDEATVASNTVINMDDQIIGLKRTHLSQEIFSSTPTALTNRSLAKNILRG